MFFGRAMRQPSLEQSRRSSLATPTAGGGGGGGAEGAHAATATAPPLSNSHARTRSTWQHSSGDSLHKQQQQHLIGVSSSSASSLSLDNTNTNNNNDSNHYNSGNLKRSLGRVVEAHAQNAPDGRWTRVESAAADSVSHGRLNNAPRANGLPLSDCISVRKQDYELHYQRATPQIRKRTPANAQRQDTTTSVTAQTQYNNATSGHVDAAEPPAVSGRIMAADDDDDVAAAIAAAAAATTASQQQQQHKPLLQQQPSEQLMSSELAARFKARDLSYADDGVR